MQPENVSNVDIVKSRQPHVLVQEWDFPDQTFMVFRKPTTPDEKFTVPEIEEDGPEAGDPDWFYIIAPTLYESGEESDDMPELFALVYLAEENGPFFDTARVPDDIEEIMAVAYHADEKCYRCEACRDGYEAVEDISAATLDDALARGLEKLYDSMAGRA